MKMSSATGVGLILLIIICYSLHSSSSEQIYNLRKFISERYFEKHGSLIDSEFSSFIENEIPCDFGKVLEGKTSSTPASLVLQRNIVGEGSHRRLWSSLRLRMQPDFESVLTSQFCVVVVIERLPSGVFADPFEVQHLVQRGVFTDAAVFGDTNLELPSFKSNRSVIEIHLDVSSKQFSRNKEDLEINLQVPLHARYQPLGLGFSKVEFGQPDVFMCCSTEQNAQYKSCLSMPTRCDSDCSSSPVLWDIPSGIKEHAGFVSVITFISAVVAVLFIVSASLRHLDNTSSNELKHM